MQIPTVSRPALLVAVLGATMFAGGCSTKEEIVDIETPRGDVRVTEDTATGEVEVDVSDEQ